MKLILDDSRIIDVLGAGFHHTRMAGFGKRNLSMCVRERERWAFYYLQAGQLGLEIGPQQRRTMFGSAAQLRMDD